MPSQLIKNDKVYFLVAKPLVYGDQRYDIGDEFPQETANNIETLVRSRYLIPVVDDIKDKPRHWHREVQLVDAALEKLTGDNVQIVLPEIVGGLAVQQSAPAQGDAPAPPEEAQQPDVIESQVEAQEPSEAEIEAAEQVGEAVHTETYDPSYHTVVEVNEYLAAHPDEREAILEAEQAGKARKGILET